MEDANATIEAPEETGTTATATESQETAAVESLINEDGSFKDGWQEKFVPEDFRGLGVFKTFNNIEGAMKQLGNLEKLRGKQGKGIMPPDENSTPTERDLFFKAIGRPDKPDGYKVEIPKGMESVFKPETIGQFKEVAHKLGLTPAQVQGLVGFDAERAKQALAGLEQTEKQSREHAEAALRQKWGAAYDQRLHLANRMINENVAEADRPAIIEKIGNDPVVADFLATIGKKFMEDKAVNTDAHETAMTPAEARNRMEELVMERAKEPQWKNPARFERLSKEIRQLAAMAE